MSAKHARDNATHAGPDGHGVCGNIVTLGLQNAHGLCVLSTHNQSGQGDGAGQDQLRVELGSDHPGSNVTHAAEVSGELAGGESHHKAHNQSSHNGGALLDDAGHQEESQHGSAAHQRVAHGGGDNTGAELHHSAGHHCHHDFKRQEFHNLADGACQTDNQYNDAGDDKGKSRFIEGVAG